MSKDEYFKDWLSVIDENELTNVLKQLNILYETKDVMPEYKNIFKAFTLCSKKDCKVVFVGCDPYPQKNIATGVAFGNNETDENKLSPSLKVLKEACIDYSLPHKTIIFDNTLESWGKQGILMLNISLTVERNKIGSHIMLWRPFIKKLLVNLNSQETGIIYVFFGENAQTFTPYISSKTNDVIKIKHPSYYARVNKPMPSELFLEINRLLKLKYGEEIKWYNEQ